MVISSLSASLHVHILQCKTKQFFLTPLCQWNDSRTVKGSCSILFLIFGVDKWQCYLVKKSVVQKLYKRNFWRTLDLSRLYGELCFYREGKTLLLLLLKKKNIFNFIFCKSKDIFFVILMNATSIWMLLDESCYVESTWFSVCCFLFCFVCLFSLQQLHGSFISES